MPAQPESSPQTRAVLSALHGHPAQWRYGYDLARETGLASGTLYPILGRLTDKGFLQTRWEEDAPDGRPRRHLYRLTPAGVARAVEAAAADRTTVRGRVRAPGRPLPEGS